MPEALAGDPHFRYPPRRDGATGGIDVRPFEDADLDAVLGLLQASLGWVPDETLRAFFAWKHVENPFGRSPAWVAELDGRVVGFRTFMRWEFDVDGEPVQAVRAVDTATHPDVQGRGLFTKLTLGALDDLCSQGIGFVFNTPNDQSRPGYLKMGWQVVGRVPIVARPRSIAALPRLTRARVPAQRWSEPCAAGEPTASVLADGGPVAQLLADLDPARAAIRTRRSLPYLRWRYGFEPLVYRALALDDDPARGVAIFRVRRRGPAREATVCELLVPADAPAARGRLVAQVVRSSGADVALAVGNQVLRRLVLRLPGQGPILTWRGVTSERFPPLESWDLELGDIELF